jgi:hypothetical protein
MILEHTALKWLAFEKNCLAVMHERTPRYCTGIPDVLGLTRGRHLIEIEIKRSVSDFKRNEKKISSRNRDIYLSYHPRQFYFFVPEEIHDKVVPLCPEWAGLAKLSNGVTFEVTKLAPVNEKSKRLTTKECVKFFHSLSNQVVSFSCWIDRIENSHRWGHNPFYWNYEI